MPSYVCIISTRLDIDGILLCCEQWIIKHLPCAWQFVMHIELVFSLIWKIHIYTGGGAVYGLKLVNRIQRLQSMKSVPLKMEKYNFEGEMWIILISGSQFHQKP